MIEFEKDQGPPLKLNFEGAGVKAHKLFARNFGQVSTLGNHSLVTTLTVDPAVATTAVLNCMPSTIPVNGSTVRGDWSVRNGRAVDRGKTVQILDETKVVATTTPLTAGTSMGIGRPRRMAWRAAWTA